MIYLSWDVFWKKYNRGNGKVTTAKWERRQEKQSYKRELVLKRLFSSPVQSHTWLPYFPLSLWKRCWLPALIFLNKLLVKREMTNFRPFLRMTKEPQSLFCILDLEPVDCKKNRSLNEQTFEQYLNKQKRKVALLENS